MFASDKNMPKVKLVDLQKSLSEEDFQIAQLCFKIGRDGMAELKASKPKVPKDASPAMDVAVHKAMYVWRMVAFTVSPIRQHQCMPVMAFCDLPEWPGKKGRDYFKLSEADKQANSAYRKSLEKAMGELADKVIDLIPKDQWHGAKRWGRALGYL